MASTVLQRSKKNKAIRLFQAGKFSEAKSLLEAICRKAATSRDAETWCLLAAVHGELGDYDASIQCCRKAVELAPRYVEAHHNLGQACMHLGRLEEAVEAYRNVLRLNPGHPDANNTIGLALDTLGRIKEAIPFYEAALRINPADVKVLLNLANIHSSLGDNTASIECARRAVSIDPRSINAQLALGHALAYRGKLDEAMAAFECAVEVDPAHLGVAVGIALVLEKRGAFDDAFKRIEPLLISEPDSAEVAVVFAKIARHVGRRQEAVALLERVLDSGKLKATEARPLHFQLGKQYDEIKDYEKAFGHFQRANALCASFNDPQESLTAMEAHIQVCTADFFEKTATSAVDSQHPIFIVGMPRSGTTLTEQVLSSHPAVFGGGEREYIGKLTERLPGLARAGVDYPDCLARLSPDILAREAQAYLDAVADLAEGAERITDKMPHNFQHLGLIALLFPNARIVHCRRNPLDNCLSIFTYEFNAAHGYAADLRELGRHYRKYEALMEHWKRVLPLPIFDVQYEDMVADQERLSRDLIEFCGLPWDDACLEFYKNQRVVNTFSYDQVRRPIYTKSVERWRNYEAWLAPLREALDIE